jgi:DNA repair exonuclease SbcCD nuclease subunit
VKLLLTSDWHGDHVTEGVSRFDDIERAVEQTVKTAVDEKVDHYCFLGDLADPDKNLSVFRAIGLAMDVAMELRQWPIRSHWLAGNHDVIEDGSNTTTLTPLKSIADNDHTYVYENPGYANLTEGADAIRMLALPFTATSNPYDPVHYASDELETDDTLVVLSHLNLSGITPGSETKELPRGREVSLPFGMFRSRPGTTLLFSGHYHQRQRYENVEIVGSLVRLTFGEENHTPGYLLVDL